MLTSTSSAFYEVFPPDEAKMPVRQLEFRYTPKYGSWLNMAKNALSALTRQCIRVISKSVRLRYGKRSIQLGLGRLAVF